MDSRAEASGTTHIFVRESVEANLRQHNTDRTLHYQTAMENRQKRYVNRVRPRGNMPRTPNK